MTDNPARAAIVALREETVSFEEGMNQLLACEMRMPSPEEIVRDEEHGETEMVPLIVPGHDGDEMLLLFSSQAGMDELAERVEVRDHLVAPFGWIVRTLGPGHGYLIDPGSDWHMEIPVETADHVFACLDEAEDP